MMTRVPPGLSRCPISREYRGTTLERYVCETPDEYEMGPDAEVRVDCICNGITCRECGETKMHRPISNSYDEETNTVIHHSWVSGLKTCKECRK